MEITFTEEVIERLTYDQKANIVTLLDHCNRVEVAVDFSLPDNYVGLKMEYKTGSVIYGGMDSEGVIST
jgi:hypothetical protein